jgi:putative SOS response-associated peptidase YedK
MCGRFTLSINELEIEERFSKKLAFRFIPQYNIRPSMNLPVITAENPLIASATWGMPRSGNPSQVAINAKLETLFRQPLFSPLISSNRCLIPADSFIEWDQSAIHQPYRFMLPDQSIFCFAGLYSDLKIANQRRRFFTIITTKAKGQVATIHSRMPLIVQRDFETQWLNDEPANSSSIEAVETSASLISVAISPIINKSVGNTPGLLLPIQKPLTLFDDIT